MQLNKHVKPLILILTICTGFSCQVDLGTGEEHPIPFVGMYIKYGFELQASGWALPGGGFMSLAYYAAQDSLYFANVSFRVYLDPFTGTENASMIEDATNRHVMVDTSGTRYVANIFHLLFDPSENATNYTPMWVYPQDLKQNMLVSLGAYDFEVLNSQEIETIGKKLNTWKLHYEESNGIMRNYTTLFESSTGLLINGEFVVTEDSSTYRGTLRLEDTNIIFEEISFLKQNLRFIIPGLFGVGLTIITLIYSLRKKIEIKGGLDTD